MNASVNASINALTRAVDGALKILNMTAGDSDLERVQWRIRETKRVLSETLREVATYDPAVLVISPAPAVGVRCVRPSHNDFVARTAEEGFSDLRETAGVYLDEVEERAVMAAGALVAFDYVAVKGKKAGQYVGRVYTSTPLMS